MKKIFIALFITFGFLCAPAQCPMDITLSTQAEVDNFFIEYPDCTHLPGKLTLLCSQINNISALLPLESVAGNLVIDGQSTTNPSLPSLEGLNNLQYIGGSLTIKNNISLSNLNGLNNLDSLGGGLSIYNCALDNLIGLESLRLITGSFYANYLSLEGLNSLTTIYGDLNLSVMQSLSGLDSLNYIGGNVDLFNNNDLPSLDGLQNLDSIGGDLKIGAADILENINELSNLQSIGGTLYLFSTGINNLSGLHHIKEIHGDVYIESNLITNFSGLENLVSIGGDLYLQDLDNLTDLTGLNNLTSVNGNFYIGGMLYLENLTALSSLEFIKGNFKLEALGTSSVDTLITSLDGLENLNYVGGDFAISFLPDLKNLNSLHNLSYIGNGVEISYSDSLSGCSIPAICGKLYYPEDDIIILDNNTGCNSQEEIESFCDVITGTCSDSILFNMQNQVDDFSINYPGCSTITGNVTIASTQIDNLEGLSGITAIEGDLTILNTDHLTDFQGLHNLNHVGGDLTIMKIDSIQNLNVFSNLQSVDSSLVIKSNISLNSLSGLDNLTHLNGDLTIENNDKLLNCSGLDNLTFINGGLRINGNNLLQNCSGLDNIGSINKWLNISYNNSMNSLNAFNKLTSIGSGLTIVVNPKLKTLSGLDSLQTLGDRYLSIQSNDSLMNISALDNIDSSILTLFVYDNPKLSECAILPICSGITNPDSYVYVTYNASGCDSIEEVLYNCASVASQVTGLVYIDMNCDSIYDNGDFVISDHILKNVSDAYPFAASSADGHFQRFLNPQSSYTFVPDSISGFSYFPASQHLSTTNAILNYSGRDFRFCPDSSFHNVQITLTDYWPLVPGFTTQYQVCVNNTGTYYENVTFTVDFSTSGPTDFIYNLEAAGGIVNGNSVTFNAGVSPFTPLCFTIYMTLSSSTPLGLDFLAHAEVQIINGSPESSLFDNTANLTRVTLGSFDPNDKTVNPQEIDYGAIDENLYLEYTIRFQNTGTFPATFIEILDTLDNKLDIRSIQMISASHPYTLSFPSQQILKWRFDNINLPDSTSNEPESHGFIRFKIKAQSELTPSDIISNNAYIIFDYNTPVITNTASTSFIVPTPEITPPDYLSIEAFPNPAIDDIMLNLKSIESDAKILITDTKGRLMQQYNITKQPIGKYNFKIDISDFSVGSYFIKVITQNRVACVKIIKLK